MNQATIGAYMTFASLMGSLLIIIFSFNASAESLVIDGMGPLTALVREAVTPYAVKNHIGISVAGNGGKAGIKCALEKTCIIGLTPEVPEEAKEKLNITMLGSNAMAILVSSDVPVRNLSTKQIINIFMGKITNWKEVGGPDLPVMVWHRKRGRGTRELFESYFKIKPAAVGKQEVGSFTELMNRANLGVRETGLIAYDSLTAALEAPDKFKLVSIDGIEPSGANVLNGKYKWTNDYLAVTHRDNKNDKVINDLLAIIKASRANSFPKMGIVYKE
jgi:phosphate transport system substrate-binding protein